MNLRNRPRLLLAASALACVAAVGAALVAQHRFGMQPCPWCVLQRVIFLLIAAVALIGALPRSRPAQRAAGLLMLPLAAAGAASALYQNLVAAKSLSCNLTLADKIISGLGLDARWPEVFEVRSSCADAAVDLFGLPFEFWALGLFVALAVAGLLAARRRF
ncbi:MAG: disulfide bond formation protein B [Pseudomonadota bacterium]